MRTVTLNDKTYQVRIEPDDTESAPWVSEDGHGPVRTTTHALYTNLRKRPGERLLHESGGTAWLYDWQEAIRIAKRDKWGPSPVDAVQADFDRLRAFARGDWQYVGVVVQPVCPCGSQATKSETASLWGIESDAGTYLDEVAQELILEMQGA
jgi:hypothetical protein